MPATKLPQHTHTPRHTHTHCCSCSSSKQTPTHTHTYTHTHMHSSNFFGRKIDNEKRFSIDDFQCISYRKNCTTYVCISPPCLLSSPFIDYPLPPPLFPRAKQLQILQVILNLADVRVREVGQRWHECGHVAGPQ